MAKVIWDLEPTLPLSNLLNAISQELPKKQIDRASYAKPGGKKLVEALREIAPEQATKRGRHRSPNFRSTDLANCNNYDVAAEKLVKQGIKKVFTEMGIDQSQTTRPSVQYPTGAKPHS